MNGRTWTDEELRTLERMVEDKARPATIARTLGRRPNVVSAKIRAMRISTYHEKRVYRYGMRLWTAQDIEYVARYYGHKPTKAIARKLNRTVTSVYQRAMRLGVAQEIREDIDRMMTDDDVAALLGVSHHTVQTWWKQHGLPYEKLGKVYITHEDAIYAWLREGHILRCTRDALPGHLQRMYDAVRREYYTKDEVLAMDVSVMTPRHWPHIAKRDGIESPRLFLVGRSGSGRGEVARLERTAYYRKDEVRAWAYRYGYLIPESTKHPDLADIVTAWLSRYIPCPELYELIPQSSTHKFQQYAGFPKQVKVRAYYDRHEVVAWMRERGMHAEARAIYRGEPLCYDDSIRERERRHA